MSFLASWLQQLILVVILAAFLDLLLPNNAMQRYVRLVMGLVILMLILSPLLTLLKNDWDVDKVLGNAQASVDGELESLSRIQDEAADLQEKQQQWVGENVQKRIEATISTAVEQEFGVSVRDVAVTLSDDGGPTGVGTLLLTIAENDKGDVKHTSIEPIRIEVNQGQKARETVSTSNFDASPRFSEIRKWLSQEWHLDEKEVHIVIDREEG